MRKRFLCPLMLILSTTSLAQEQLLKDKFVGHILVIRNFYIEPLLRYDASGHIKHSAQSGEWTVAQFKIEKVSLNANSFALQGRRIAVGYDQKKDSVTFYQLDPLTIKVEDLPPDTLTQQKLDELTHQIFVVLRDEPETVPDYWRDLVSGNVVADKDEKGHKVYRLKNSPPFKQGHPGEIASEAMNSPQSAPVYRVGGDVTPPRIIKQRDPNFSELARQLKYQGTTILELIINETGTPEDIKIIRLAGFGLDEGAVQAVKNWVFKPSTRNGQPVKVVVKVEVNYKLR
jgi:TonB family protein